jgi:hypothetical protein
MLRHEDALQKLKSEIYHLARYSQDFQDLMEELDVTSALVDNMPRSDDDADSDDDRDLEEKSML